MTLWPLKQHKHQYPLRWRHNGRDSVSNHQPHDCLLNHLLSCGEFTGDRQKMASNAEYVSISWRHHAPRLSRVENPCQLPMMLKTNYFVAGMKTTRSTEFLSLKLLSTTMAFNIDGLMQERRNSIANSLELHLSCTNPSIWNLFYMCSPMNHRQIKHMHLLQNYERLLWQNKRKRKFNEKLYFVNWYVYRIIPVLSHFG